MAGCVVNKSLKLVIYHGSYLLGRERAYRLCYSLLMVIITFAAVAARSVASETLPDPTKPPVMVQMAPDSNVPTAPRDPVLQSVFISGTQKSAIIDGLLVPLGGRVGNAKLVKVAEGEAVLQTDSGYQTLKLLPNIEKTPSQRRPSIEKKLKSGKAVPSGGPGSPAR